MSTIQQCRYCEESFTLLPGKPGFANVCPPCQHELDNPPAPKPGSDIPPYRRNVMNLMEKLWKKNKLNEEQKDAARKKFTEFLDNNNG